MEHQILNSFTNKDSESFNNLSKKLKIRTNKLAYHLKKLSQEGIIKKQDDLYSLTNEAESKIPYLSEKSSPLPVILIELKKNNSIFLHKREKRPYKDLLALPGGRLEIGESPKEAAKRIMLSKFQIKIKNPKIKSISLEHLQKNKKTINSFILIKLEAKTLQNIHYTNPNKLKSKIIPSDYKLIKNKKQSKILETLITKT